jgi:hypothetical protein
MLPARGATISGPLATSASVAASTWACDRQMHAQLRAQADPGSCVVSGRLSGALPLFQPVKKSKHSTAAVLR